VNAIAPRARTRMITQTFGADAMAPPPDGFDEYAPENVAPLVTYLAGPDAGHITGRCFVVAGGLVELLEGWRQVAAVDNGARWTVDRLPAAVSELMECRTNGC